MLDFYLQFKFIGFSPANGYLYSAEVGFFERSIWRARESLNFEQFREKNIIFEIHNTDYLNLLIESNFANGDLCVFFNSTYIGEWLKISEIEDCVGPDTYQRGVYFQNAIDFFLANNIHPSFDALDLIKLNEEYKVVPIDIDTSLELSSSILGENTDVYSGSFNHLKSNYPRLFSHHLNGNDLDLKMLWTNEEFKYIYRYNGFGDFTESDILLGRRGISMVRPLSAPGGNELKLNQTELDFSLLSYSVLSTIQIPGLISLSNTNFYFYGDYQDWETRRDNSPFFIKNPEVLLKNSYARYLVTCLVSNTKSEYILDQEQFHSRERRGPFYSFLDYLKASEGSANQIDELNREGLNNLFEGDTDNYWNVD